VKREEVRVIGGETVEFENEAEEVEDEPVLAVFVTKPGHPYWLVLSCTVRKSPVPLCSITTSSQLNVATIETLTAGPSVKFGCRNS
jgi:hypothetical protein